jgi:hypothetical protein
MGRALRCQARNGWRGRRRERVHQQYALSAGFPDSDPGREKNLFAQCVPLRSGLWSDPPGANQNPIRERTQRGFIRRAEKPERTVQHVEYSSLDRKVLGAGVRSP